MFAARCAGCHGPAGAGQPLPGGRGYRYPPLWNPHSYNDGANLFRVISLARFVKAAMPFGATFDHPQLANARVCAQVAACINSRPT